MQVSTEFRDEEQVAPPKLFLRGGESEGPKGKTNPPGNPTPEAEGSNLKRNLGVGALVLLGVGLGAGVYMLLSDTDTAASAVAPFLTEQPTFAPTLGPSISPTTAPVESSTTLPTESPSISPSLAPTESPTESPTTIDEQFPPTFAPTLPPTLDNVVVSRLPCEEIRASNGATQGNFGDNNFKVQEVDGKKYCGDTYGPDPKRPNRNPWSVRIGRRDCPTFTYDEGIEICDTVGARWCTVEEFEIGIANATGCGGDQEFVYTSTDCNDVNNDGAPGKVMFDVGLQPGRAPFYFCESDLNRLSLARCCGDFETN